MFGLAGTALPQDELSIRRSIRVLHSVLSCVGVQYEWKESVEAVNSIPDSVKNRAYFASNSTTQLVLNVAPSMKIGGDLPVQENNLSRIGKGVEVFCTTIEPRQSLCNLDFRVKVAGPCLFRISANWSRFPVEPILPGLNARRNGKAVDFQQLADVVFDPEKKWRKIESSSGASFVITTSNAEQASMWKLKSNLGKDIKLIHCVVANFESNESGLPSTVWKTAEYEIDGNRFLLPLEAAVEILSLTDWREIQPGISFPFATRHKYYINSLSLPDMLDENKGNLTKLTSGTLNIPTELVKTIDTVVSQFQLYPANSSFYIPPPNGNYAADLDTKEVFVVGLSKEESDKFLGIDTKPPPKARNFPSGWLFAFLCLVGTCFLIHHHRSKGRP